MEEEKWYTLNLKALYKKYAEFPEEDGQVQVCGGGLYRTTDAAGTRYELISDTGDMVLETEYYTAEFDSGYVEVKGVNGNTDKFLLTEEEFHVAADLSETKPQTVSGKAVYVEWKNQENKIEMVGVFRDPDIGYKAREEKERELIAKGNIIEDDFKVWIAHVEIM